jgi:hypothetical protein
VPRRGPVIAAKAIFGAPSSAEAVYTASHLTIAAHPQGRLSQLGKAKDTPR